MPVKPRAEPGWIQALRDEAAARAPLCIAFSGGLDSSVLLHALARNPARRLDGLRALHVDHGLQAASPDWVAHCVAVCAALGVPLRVCKVSVRNEGDGPEAAARAARYTAFAAELRSGEILVLAQHRDDQAETVLLRLLRGAGSLGLAGMPAERGLGQARLWRPLLEVARADLLAYARANALTWVDDCSNADPRLDRNYLRHRILPLLRERWPQADRALAASAAWLREDANLLHAEAAARLAPMIGADGSLDLAALNAQPALWRSRLLRRWVADAGLPLLPQRGVEEVLAAWPHADADALPSYRWQGATLRRWRQRLWGERDPAPWPAGWQADWNGRQPLPLPDGSELHLHGSVPADLQLKVCGRRTGERLRLPGRCHQHALKHLLQDLGVPPWRRRDLPLLFAADGELLAIAGLLDGAGMQALGLHCERCRGDVPLAH